MSDNPRHPRRFRITVEGVTRYMGASGKSADVTLTMPTYFRNNGEGTRSLQLGAMPLAGVEWLPEPVQPPKVGDVIENADTFDSLPRGAVVVSGEGDELDINVRTEIGWIDDGGDRFPSSALARAGTYTLVYLPGVTP